MNISFDAINKSIATIPQGSSPQYIELMCQGYGQWFSSLHLKLAVVNLSFYLIYPILERYDGKMLLDMDIGKHHLTFSVKDLKTIVLWMFMLINFFYFGYWLVYGNADKLIDLPVVSWFV